MHPKLIFPYYYYYYYYYKLFLPEARCVCRPAAVKAAKFLPLDGLARSKQDPFDHLTHSHIPYTLITMLISKIILEIFPWLFDCLPCMQFCHEHGYPLDRQTCSNASSNGSFDCLRYAHEHGCPWESDTLHHAARTGQLGPLTYAHEHGCPFDPDEAIECAVSGCWLQVCA